MYNVRAQQVAVLQLPFFPSCCYFVVSICINCKVFFFHSITRSLFLSRSTNATHTDIVYTPPSCNEAYINYTSSRLDQPADRYSVICRDLCLLLNLRKQALAVSQTLWILVMFAQGIKTDTPQESTLYNLPFVLPCHTR